MVSLIIFSHIGFCRTGLIAMVRPTTLLPVPLFCYKKFRAFRENRGRVENLLLLTRIVPLNRSESLVLVVVLVLLIGNGAVEDEDE